MSVATKKLHTEIRTIFENILRESTEACLRELNGEARYEGAMVPTLGDNEPQLIAFLGFIGDGIKGALSLAASPATVRALLPATVRSQLEEPDLRDWAEEVSNLILGRVQNKLIARNIDINIATPTSIAGTGVTVRETASDEQWHRYAAHDASVVVRLTVEIAATFEWDPDAADSEPPVAEGEGLMF